MSSFIKQLQFGSLTLPNNIFYAPLAGCSDFPFRMMSRKYGNPGLLFCEMVKMDALVRNDPNTYRLLDYHPNLHPIGAQLCGSKPELAAESARILEDLGFDTIDLNCGCPVDKVTKDGSGSGLLKTPEKIGEILSNIIAAVKIPVTVKIRAGWDSTTINAPLITQIAEKAGAQAITIHGRTRAQAYNGPAKWDYIKEAKQVANKIKVIGNGDIYTPEDAQRMFEQTGCDGVLIARGTMGQPWIARDIIDFIEKGTTRTHSQQEYKEALLDHIRFISDYQEIHHATLAIRRIGTWYLREIPGVREFRGAISHIANVSEAITLIHNIFK